MPSRCRWGSGFALNAGGNSILKGPVMLHKIRIWCIICFMARCHCVTQRSLIVSYLGLQGIQFRAQPFTIWIMRGNFVRYLLLRIGWVLLRLNTICVVIRGFGTFITVWSANIFGLGWSPRLCSSWEHVWGVKARRFNIRCIQRFYQPTSLPYLFRLGVWI